MDFMSYAFAIVTLIVGTGIGFILHKKSDEKNIAGAKANAEAIVDDAIKQAQILKKEKRFSKRRKKILSTVMRLSKS